MMRTLNPRRALPITLLAGVALGCGSTAPSTLPATPGPSGFADPTSSVVPDLTPAPSPTPVPGSSTAPGDGVFRTIILSANGTAELPVVLQDLTGLVVGIEPVTGNEPPFDEGVSNPRGRPSVLRYRWTGGACDTLTRITFERVAAGFRLASATTTTGGACILIGIGRGVDIHLSEPIDAGSVVLGDR